MVEAGALMGELGEEGGRLFVFKDVFFLFQHGTENITNALPHDAKG
jgi:hypothetical protein